MEADNPHASEQGHRVQALTGPYVRARFLELPEPLQLEAIELMHRLNTEPDFKRQILQDFSRDYEYLDNDDRVAFLWALMDHPADISARWKAMLRAA